MQQFRLVQPDTESIKTARLVIHYVNHHRHIGSADRINHLPGFAGTQQYDVQFVVCQGRQHCFDFRRSIDIHCQFHVAGQQCRQHLEVSDRECQLTQAVGLVSFLFRSIDHRLIQPLQQPLQSGSPGITCVSATGFSEVGIYDPGRARDKPLIQPHQAAKSREDIFTSFRRDLHMDHAFIKDGWNQGGVPVVSEQRVEGCAHGITFILLVFSIGTEANFLDTDGRTRINQSWRHIATIAINRDYARCVDRLTHFSDDTVGNPDTDRLLVNPGAGEQLQVGHDIVFCLRGQHRQAQREQQQISTTHDSLLLWPSSKSVTGLIPCPRSKRSAPSI